MILGSSTLCFNRITSIVVRVVQRANTVQVCIIRDLFMHHEYNKWWISCVCQGWHGLLYYTGSGMANPTGDCDVGWFCPSESTEAQPPGNQCLAGHQCPIGSATQQPCPTGFYQVIRYCTLHYDYISKNSHTLIHCVSMFY